MFRRLDPGESTSFRVTGVWSGSPNDITCSVNVEYEYFTSNSPASRELPKHTELFSNFPNPFNPETWIPYNLSEPADVFITIYNIKGEVVRKLDLGLKPAGIYQSRSKAAYWDGKNEFGEKVASGVYFYTLTAGEFSATRKMLIRK